MVFLTFSGSKVILEQDWKMVFAVVKKDGAGKHRPKQNATEKHSEERKGAKTQNMPPCEELRGDSPSGLAANAPFRSALS